MKIAISHNAWHVCGGGELYIGALAEELAQTHEVDLILASPFPAAKLRSLLGLHFRSVGRRVLQAPERKIDGATRYERLCGELALQAMAHSYDLVIRVGTGTVPPPCGRRSLLHVQAPFVAASGAWAAGQQAWNRSTGRAYDAIIFNSDFTARACTKVLGSSVRHHVLHPPVELGEDSLPPWMQRPQVILGVGRFDEAGHCKRQLELVSTFRRMVEGGLTGWKLVLAGGVINRRSSQSYAARVAEAATGLPIEIAINLPRAEVLKLYRESRIFWHAAGYGADEEKHPDAVEHFGITTVEAMARGCIPLVIDLGGQKEIVDHGRTGWRWRTLADLEHLTWRVMQQRAEESAAGSQAAHEASRRFSRGAFARAAHTLVSQLEHAGVATG